MPITITRPRHSRIARTAAAKASSCRAASARRACASISNVCLASVSARCASNVELAAMRGCSLRIGHSRPRVAAASRAMATTLEVVLLYLVAAVIGVVLCRTLKLPPMLGYLVVGVVIGPNALSLAGDATGARSLAEFGVVFLMFVIG